MKKHIAKPATLSKFLRDLGITKQQYDEAKDLVLNGYLTFHYYYKTPWFDAEDKYSFKQGRDYLVKEGCQVIALYDRGGATFNQRYNLKDTTRSFVELNGTYWSIGNYCDYSDKGIFKVQLKKKLPYAVVPRKQKK